MLACNLALDSGGGQDLAATITAQAAELQTANEAAAASPTPELAAPDAGGPEVTVSADTNCRTGPSTDFEVVLTMHPGASAPVIGKYTPGDYWIISNATGGSCWLWGKYATVTGDTGSLPDYPAPAAPSAQPTKEKKPTKTPAPSKTPEPVVPSAPGNLAWNRTCEGGYASDGVTPIWIEAITLTWQDSSNETGYRVYKSGSAVPDLPADSTSYNITMRYPQGTGQSLYINFEVEAFNAAGSSPRSGTDVFKCP
jgi:hypothetical protein